MSRLPIRLRLTGVFVVVMGVVLLVVGYFLYVHTRHVLDHSINAELRTRQSALRSYVASVDHGPTGGIPTGQFAQQGEYAQVISPHGRVIASSPPGEDSMLTASEVVRASRRTTVITRDEALRFRAGPASFSGKPVVVVAGDSLVFRERALGGLRNSLLLGLPLALLVAGGIAYAIAGRALGAVEAIRRRAETIVRADPDARVPVPKPEDEVRRLARTLNDMLQRLAGAAVQERAFAANASHELRTPLTALSGELELALKHGSTLEQLQAALRRCQQDTHRLIALADGLLLLARSDDGPLAARELTPVDDLLAGVAHQAQGEAQAQGRAVSVDPGGVVAAVDPLALTRAVRNLVENALIHGRGDITLAAERDPAGCVVVSVCDDGRIEDPELPAHAFDRFYRGRDAAHRPGAGLGLALVEAVAIQHGGSAHLGTGPDGRTRARLVLDARSV